MGHSVQRRVQRRVSVGADTVEDTAYLRFTSHFPLDPVCSEDKPSSLLELETFGTLEPLCLHGNFLRWSDHFAHHMPDFFQSQGHSSGLGAIKSNACMYIYIYTILNVCVCETLGIIGLPLKLFI